MAQTWHDLLFAHWPVASDSVRPLLPAGLELDTFEDHAWIGVVPFRMSGVRMRFTPSVPWLAAFPELNLRTYVKLDGRAGVWFFCLEAARLPAVQVARSWFHLPYFHARMECTAVGNDIEYSSERIHRRARPASFRARYGPEAPVVRARSGTLEHWLTERYCLYAADDRGRLMRGEIHHVPWPLQEAHARIETCTLPAAHDLELPSSPPHLRFARRLDVRIWAPSRCD
ncbi:MAG: DUF2071 domain-containing protein [Planctomycetes bacterium]|nr:DUF2071 domain-containing protein [Planctomycetota bacterium]